MQWNTPHLHNVGIAIINHPPNHHKWVVYTIKDWWFIMAIPTLHTYTHNFPINICVWYFPIAMSLKGWHFPAKYRFLPSDANVRMMLSGPTPTFESCRVRRVYMGSHRSAREICLGFNAFGSFQDFCGHNNAIHQPWLGMVDIPTIYGDFPGGWFAVSLYPYYYHIRFWTWCRWFNTWRRPKPKDIGCSNVRACLMSQFHIIWLVMVYQLYIYR